MHKIAIIKGQVIVGKQVGKAIGFPTANVMFTKEQAKELNLETGVFATLITTNNLYSIKKGVSCISKIKDGRYLIETHIIDINQQNLKLYGYDFKMAFIEKIREEETFKSKQELIEKIALDVSQVKEFFNNRKTCQSCNICYKQDYGYSNYTVEGSAIGCYLNHFDEYDEYDLDKLQTQAHNQADNCKDYNKGEMCHLDVDGEDTGASEEQIKIWSRQSKINQIVD